MRTCLAAAAREMHVPVDQTRDDPAAGDVHLLDPERPVERWNVPSDPDDPLAGHEQVPATLGGGVVQLGVSEQDERRTVHSSLKPPTAPVSRSAASARCVALDEISSVDALSCSAAAAISSAAAA